MQEQHLPGVAVFNFAHSYAQSAVTLQEHETVATHGDAPIYFLFFHAVELYLKAFLMKRGLTEGQLRNKYGHKVKALAEAATAHGLALSPVVAAVIQHMDETDNAMSSRYIRLGPHSQVPIADVFTACEDLHQLIGPAVYADTGVTRVPILRRGAGKE